MPTCFGNFLFDKMGKVLSRNKSSQSLTTPSPKTNAPAPIENQLSPLHQRLKNLKEQLRRFEPTVGASWDALYSETQALQDECSRLLSSNSWQPTPKERDAIASLMQDTGHLVGELRLFSERSAGLTPDKIAELNALIDSERREIEALIAEFESEIVSKKISGEAIESNRLMKLLKKFGHSVRRVGLFLGRNARLEASLVTSIATGNVVGAVIEGIELAASAYSSARPAATATTTSETRPTDAAALTSENNKEQKASSASKTLQKANSNNSSEELKTQDSTATTNLSVQSEAASTSLVASVVPAGTLQTDASLKTTNSKPKLFVECEVQTEPQIPSEEELVKPAKASNASSGSPTKTIAEVRTLPGTRQTWASARPNQLSPRRRLQTEPIETSTFVETPEDGSDNENSDQSQMSSAGTAHAKREGSSEKLTTTNDTQKLEALSPPPQTQNLRKSSRETAVQTPAEMS